MSEKGDRGGGGPLSQEVKGKQQMWVEGNR